MTEDRIKIGKRPAYRDLKPGDPWIFFPDKPMQIDFEDGEGIRVPRVGDLIGKWFSTDEPGRNFRVTSISGNAYETVFVGFQEFPEPRVEA